MATSTTSTGIASGGFDVKLTTTQPLSPLSIAAPVTLGTGDLTLKINGDVTQTSRRRHHRQPACRFWARGRSVWMRL